MLWTGRFEARAEPYQVRPTQLGIARMTGLGRDPGGHFGTAPEPAVGGWTLQGCDQPRLLLRAQNRLAAGIIVAPVAEGVGACLVVAPHELADPAHAVASDLRHLWARLALRQQPDNLKVAALDWILGAPVALLQLGQAQMLRHHGAFRHRPLPSPSVSRKQAAYHWITY